MHELVHSQRPAAIIKDKAALRLKLKASIREHLARREVVDALVDAATPRFATRHKIESVVPRDSCVRPTDEDR